MFDSYKRGIPQRRDTSKCSRGPFGDICKDTTFKTSFRDSCLDRGRYSCKDSYRDPNRYSCSNPCGDILRRYSCKDHKSMVSDAWWNDCKYPMKDNIGQNTSPDSFVCREPPRPRSRSRDVCEQYLSPCSPTIKPSSCSCYAGDDKSRVTFRSQCPHQTPPPCRDKLCVGCLFEEVSQILTDFGLPPLDEILCKRCRQRIVTLDQENIQDGLSCKHGRGNQANRLNDNVGSIESGIKSSQSSSAIGSHDSTNESGSINSQKSTGSSQSQKGTVSYHSQKGPVSVNSRKGTGSSHPRRGTTSTGSSQRKSKGDDSYHKTKRMASKSTGTSTRILEDGENPNIDYIDRNDGDNGCIILQKERSSDQSNKRRKFEEADVSVSNETLIIEIHSSKRGSGKKETRTQTQPPEYNTTYRKNFSTDSVKSPGRENSITPNIKMDYSTEYSRNFNEEALKEAYRDADKKITTGGEWLDYGSDSPKIEPINPKKDSRVSDRPSKHLSFQDDLIQVTERNSGRKESVQVTSDPDSDSNSDSGSDSDSDESENDYSQSSNKGVQTVPPYRLSVSRTKSPSRVYRTFDNGENDNANHEYDNRRCENFPERDSLVRQKADEEHTHIYHFDGKKQKTKSKALSCSCRCKFKSAKLSGDECPADFYCSDNKTYYQREKDHRKRREKKKKRFNYMNDHNLFHGKSEDCLDSKDDYIINSVKNTPCLSRSSTKHKERIPSYL